MYKFFNLVIFIPSFEILTYVYFCLLRLTQSLLIGLLSTCFLLWFVENLSSCMILHKNRIFVSLDEIICLEFEKVTQTKSVTFPTSLRP